VYLSPPEPKAFGAAIVRALRERTPMPDLGAFEWDALALRFEASLETARRGSPVASGDTMELERAHATTESV
jgi:hypothetical protein